ncbi:MAG: hypothetical protein ACOY4F_07180 [Thermodesulfobacteriota bacterium]
MRVMFVCLALLLPATLALAQEESLFTSLQKKGQPTARSRTPTTDRIIDGLEKRLDTAAPPSTTVPRPAGLAKNQTGSSPGKKMADATGQLSDRLPAEAQNAGRLSDAKGRFAGRVRPDGKGGYRTYDATGRHTRTMTPDGRGGYRVFDPQGRFLGRVNMDK